VELASSDYLNKILQILSGRIKNNQNRYSCRLLQAQTALEFVVDSLYNMLHNKLYNKSTTNRSNEVWALPTSNRTATSTTVPSLQSER